MVDLLIRNGEVVTDTKHRHADVAVDGGSIVAIGPGLELDAAEVIDAAGKYVFPGFIDPHTHMELPVAGTVSSDDFCSGTRAAAAGGITTIVDFVSMVPEQTFEEVIGLWRTKAEKAVIDYGFHIIVPELTDDQLAQVAAGDLLAEGISTIKCMMAYKRGPQGSGDENLLKVIHAAVRAGMLPMVHAENGDAVDVQADRLIAAGMTSPRYHPCSRPGIVEAEAVNRAGMLAALAGSPMYIVHLSSCEALEALQMARARGWDMYAETCPQYLTLDDSLYDAPGFEAAKYVCSPPLRPREGQDELWSALAADAIHLVASDHCSFRYGDQKVLGKADFRLIPNGMPVIEPMFSLIFDRGVRNGRMDVQRFAAVSSTNAARIFGMYPRKGTIEVGSDADLVIFDPERKRTLSRRALHSNVDYTPFEGCEVVGLPAVTISRGTVVARDGEPVETVAAGRGRYIARSPWTGNPLRQGGGKHGNS